MLGRVDGCCTVQHPLSSGLHGVWREVVDLKIPARDDRKIHLMSHRASTLTIFIEVGKIWKAVLGPYTPTDPQDQREFDGP